MTISGAATMMQGSGRVAISILARTQAELAPDGVFFRASVDDPGIVQATGRSGYDPSFHDCTYIWDFGDPGAVSDKVVNLPAAHNDLNCAYGKEVGHVFTRPGRHTVTCTVYGPEGPVGSDALDIEVGDPDRAFAPEQTILLDPDSPEAHREDRDDAEITVTATLQEGARRARGARGSGAHPDPARRRAAHRHDLLAGLDVSRPAPRRLRRGPPAGDRDRTGGRGPVHLCRRRLYRRPGDTGAGPAGTMGRRRRTGPPTGRPRPGQRRPVGRCRPQPAQHGAG
jgi:hypothetical protein